jgi:carbonic anhydrase/acetyltransferase-like protein (isoleucine patch superfamily)
MIKSFGGKTPRIAESALVSETACIIGDVEIGEESSVWPGAVVRSDWNVLQHEPGTRIGNNTHIEDNAVVHGTTSIGSSVMIGHGAVVEAFKIGDNVLIGDNASILASAEIGSFCLVAAGSVVRQGMQVPDRSFVAGAPAEIKGEVSTKHLEAMEETRAGLAYLVRAYKQSGESL